MVLAKEPQVWNMVLELSEPFYAHAEGIAGVLFGVNAAGLKNIRVYHAAA
jgi:hypothetical protein